MTVVKSNGKPQMRDFVVTYTFDCYESVRATSPEDAAAKVLRGIQPQFGRRNAQVTNVEEA